MGDLPSKQVSAPDCQLNWEAVLARLEALEATAPTSGDIIGFAGTSRTGYLLCDGSVYDPDAYPELYAEIGTTWGGTAGSPLLPDFRGRAPVGAGTGDATGATAHTLGAKVGKETHVLSTAEMPAHTHGAAGGANFVVSGAGTSAFSAGSAWNQAAATASTGGGGAHENRTPSTVINFFIKT